MAADLRDPRRVGFVASIFAASYLALLFLPESLTFRSAFVAVMFPLGTAFSMLVPLPRGQEPEDRKRLAAKWMVVESFAFMVLGTVVRWWTA